MTDDSESAHIRVHPRPMHLRLFVQFVEFVEFVAKIPGFVQFVKFVAEIRG